MTRRVAQSRTCSFQFMKTVNSGCIRFLTPCNRHTDVSLTWRIVGGMPGSGVVRMDWPACSPDLSPTANVWDHLERQVREKHPPLATLPALLGLLQQEWLAIPQAFLRTEQEVADQTFYLHQSQCNDTGPISPNTDPVTQTLDRVLEYQFLSFTGKAGIEHRVCRSLDGRLTTWPKWRPVQSRPIEEN